MDEAQPVNGRFSRETLTHFSCGRCRGWWSIGDPPPHRRLWFCPWCGQEQIINLEDEQQQEKDKGA